jgi:hypothetical protein
MIIQTVIAYVKMFPTHIYMDCSISVSFVYVCEVCLRLVCSTDRPDYCCNVPRQISDGLPTSLVSLHVQEGGFGRICTCH